MLKLHGFPISNFYCIAKQALLEKGLAFEEVNTMPNQEPAFLDISPMGKVPALSVAAGCLTETSVILDYLEDTHPEPPLYPADPFERAKVRQLIKVVEMYIENPAHLMIGALFGSEVPEPVRDNAKALMHRGLAALERLAQFDPWICGGKFSYADIFTYHSFSVIRSMAEKLYDWEVMADVPGLQAWYERMAQRPVTVKIDTESRASLQAFMKQLGK